MCYNSVNQEEKSMKTTVRKTLKLFSVVLLTDVVAFNLMLLFLYAMGWWPIMFESKAALLIDWGLANFAYLLTLVFVPISLHKRMSAPFHVIKKAAYTSLAFIVLYNALLGMSHMFVPGFFRSALIAFCLFAFVCFERLSARKILANYRTGGGNQMHVILIGYSYNVQQVIKQMKLPWTGYAVIGLFSDTEENEADTGVTYLGKVSDALALMQQQLVNEIYIGLPEEQDEKLEPIIRYCEQNMIKIFYVPQTHSNNSIRTYRRDFGDTYVMARYNEPLHRMSNRFLKRTFDLIFSSLFLFTLFPIIFIVVAIITKINMPGPVFFKQKRTGYGGEDFMMIKFRSMKVNDEADQKQATKDDDRVTKWGHFLRHSSIDELPQFINVFLGDMSVVGPRPHMLAHTEYYSARISDYMVRHYVKPGITGWAQTHGSRGETQEVKDMADRVEKDIWYVEHWSIWLDLHIIVKTLRDAVLGDPKAY